MKLSRRAFMIGLGAAGGWVAGGAMEHMLLRIVKLRKRSNIVLFVADDMRYDAAGFAGNGIIRTPNLDLLARQGIVFDNHFVTTSICPTSRASIMCGEYVRQHGVYDFETRMRQDCFVRSFPYLLRRHGYHTGFIGKWGMGGEQPVRLFNTWHGYMNDASYYPRPHAHITDIETLLAVQFLRERPSGPYLLIVSYKAPHTPLVPQRRLEELYRDVAIPRAKTDNAADGVVPEALAHSAGRQHYAESMYDDHHYQEHMRRYYRLITGMDASIGQIMEEIKRQGDDGRTSVVFTSDNGMMMGEHQLCGKWAMYEESIRAPLIIRPAPRLYPDLKPARVSAMSLNVDISPTILQMATVPLPFRLHGKSLLPLMSGENGPWRKGFYYEQPPMPKLRVAGCEGYRTGQWKYSRYAGKEECLFDLENDPLELANLAGAKEHASTLRYLRAATAAGPD